MKVLNIEDDILKHIAIERELGRLKIQDCVHMDNLESGLNVIKTEDFDFIITDMNYPLSKGKEENNNAGSILLNKLREMGNDTPVILISSVSYKIDGFVECIRYSENDNWEWDLKKAIDMIKKDIEKKQEPIVEKE